VYEVSGGFKMTPEEIFEALEEKSECVCDLATFPVDKEKREKDVGDRTFRIIKESDYQQIKRQALAHYFIEDDVFGKDSLSQTSGGQTGSNFNEKISMGKDTAHANLNQKTEQERAK